MSNPKRKLLHNIQNVWKHDLPLNFQLRWMDIWVKHWAKKKLAFSSNIGGQNFEDENKSKHPNKLPLLLTHGSWNDYS
jgi:hypothetical protein